jgi:RluA family pseudouridine synthase
MSRFPHAPHDASNMESFRVSRADAATLQDFLAAKLGVSRRAAKAVIDGRSVWVNRRAVWMARHSLSTGDVVEVPRAVASAARRHAGAEKAAPPPAERRHVRVLVEAGDYLVADKPAGMLSNNDPKSVEAVLREQLGEPELQAVHRLDRDTTGCLLFARTPVAHLAAVEVFKTRSVSKSYAAIVVGSFPHAHMTIDAPLDGQPAQSNVSREMASPDASLLRVRIETGRTHQIRRHLASVRFPVVGDRTFGLKSARDPRLMSIPRQMLHAATLELPDPTVKGARIKAHSPLPADFRAALRLFGLGPKKKKRGKKK